MTAIRLTDDEMQTGMMISDQAMQLRAALAAVSQLEAQYIEQLRAKYGVPQEWTISQWTRGLEGEEHGKPNN